MSSNVIAAEPETNANEVKKGEGTEPDPAEQALARLRLSIQRVTLENGLRVVMNVDTQSPTVAVSVTYDVGARNEEPGRTGFAHLFEHMMFQGSRNVKKGQHFQLLSARGGSLNGTTSSDRTNYFEVLPSNELALALWLEADRMRWLDVTPENFENQRRVVQEEYRMRYQNAAYAMGMLRLRELAYGDYFPYAHSAIGSMQDLETAEFAWVKSFHEAYYAPNNAVLCIAGDFDPDRAMALVREYFGEAEKSAAIPRYEPPELSAQTAERRDTVPDENAKTPGFYYGYVIPPARTKEHFALEVAAAVLGDGESSRLHQLLVRQRALARATSAFTFDQRGPDLFGVRVLLTESADLKEVQRLVDQELERLRQKPPTEPEMERARSRIRSSFLFGLQSNLRRAALLGEFEVFTGDARLLTRELERYLDVRAEDVRQAVERYLAPARRTVVDVVPTNPKGETP